MNRTDIKYQKFGLCTDMMKTADLIKNFNLLDVMPFMETTKDKRKIFITGEGSSRIFPAKNMIYNSLRFTAFIDIKTEGSSQAQEYDLKGYSVFGVSNSGKTSELINLFTKLKDNQHPDLYGITAHSKTPLEFLAHQTNILKCGLEKSVAATISVIEQALFFDILFSNAMDVEIPFLEELSDKFFRVLSINIPNEIISQIINAEIIYFAGRNNGVAEELTLKTNEILRKRSDFLEGTYAVHGIEEVMTNKDVMIIIDPIEGEEAKFNKYLAEGVGLNIIAISSRQTMFPTILIPKIEYFEAYLQMAAGWNLLVECGLQLGVDLDKPQRARKIGNEFQTTI